jgi:uncharacterized membrane protein
MSNLIAAAAAFVGLHVLVAGTRLRDVLIARLGAGPYRGLFSACSAASLFWLIYAYRPLRVLAAPPEAIALILVNVVMAIAFCFAVVGLLTPAPTAVGGEALLAKGIEPRGIHRITRHPFLWGVMLWAAVHIATTHRMPDWIFFATFLVLAAVGQPSIDAKRARTLGSQWQGYVQQTSAVPFAAILQGRNRLALGELLSWRMALALLAYAGMAAVHARLFGISPW